MSDRFGDNVDAGEIDAVTGNHFGFEGEHDLSVDFYGDGPVSDYLPHISKSRIKKFLKCRRKFAFKYLAEVRAEDNFYITRGTRVHDTYETFHQNLIAYTKANQEPPRNFTELLSPADEWFQFIDFIHPFFKWELERWETALSNTETEAEALEAWTPHSVEDSLEIEDPPVGEVPWIGPYDCLVDARSVSSINSNEGYVVIDYKTGSLPGKEKWAEEGIYIDLEFYAWMLEEDGFDIAGGVGMYPSEDGNVVREMPNEDIRAAITEVVKELHTASATRDEFPTYPNPLCDWCFYQDQCPTAWDS